MVTYDCNVSVMKNYILRIALPSRHRTTKNSLFLIIALALFGTVALAQNPHLALDRNFTTELAGDASAQTRAIAVQKDGRILVGGTFTAVNGAPRNYLARLNSDGTLDSTFNASLETDRRQGQVNSILVLPDGKILAGGRFTASGGERGSLVRFDPDGSLDHSFAAFNYQSFVRKLLLQPDGKILIAGALGLPNQIRFRQLARLNPNGTPDTDFSAEINPGGIVEAIEIQTDGRILVGGFFTAVNGALRNNIARLETSGTLDANFDSGAGTDYSILALAVQNDGGIIIGGNFNSYRSIPRRALARLLPDGSLDTAYAAATDTDCLIKTIVVQPDGTTLVGGAGTFYQSSTVSTNYLTRVGADGRIEENLVAGFDYNGHNNSVQVIVRQPDGKILAGGAFNSYNGIAHRSIIRLQRQAPAVLDFDGDGRSDIGVFRPSNGVWYLQKSTTGFAARQFGLADDRTVPADYDGDGKTDIAVWRAGFWYLQRSSAGFAAVQFGQESDVPTPIDFDGDGRAELAVFRPSNGTWYQLNPASNQFRAVQFGLSGDIPVPADYDADGRSDYAVYRPSSGVWYLLQSTKGFAAVEFGISTDKPVVGDYDGDGQADPAVYRPSEGNWYLLKSAEGFAVIQFGLSTDIPTPADYDGDGKTDIGVFRNGTWYLRQSANGFRAVQFGMIGDLPARSNLTR
jgi:uncharacterized delta-60 repeat protein